jgi:hypothetical protein
MGIWCGPWACLEGAEAQDLCDCGRWFGWRALMKRGGGRVSALRVVSNAMVGTHQATRWRYRSFDWLGMCARTGKIMFALMRYRS